MRPVIFLIVITFSVPGFCFAEIDLRLLPIFYELWKDSGFGKDPNRTERAAWILRHDSGKNEVIRWRTSGTRNAEYWKGMMPNNTILLAHTHTVTVDPRPSRKDITLAARIGVPVYTISQRGIWMVDASGKISQLANWEWYSSIANAPGE